MLTFKYMKPTLFLMLGYPGAGKTTAAEVVSKLTGATHLASDKIRLEMFPNPQFTPEEHQALYEAIDARTSELLKAGKSVIYDANLNRHQHRAEKYRLCKKIGATSVLLWVKTPEELSKSRAVDYSRSHLWPQGEAADKMFDRLVTVFETPTEEEPYLELDGTKISENYVQEKLRNVAIIE